MSQHSYSILACVSEVRRRNPDGANFDSEFSEVVSLNLRGELRIRREDSARVPTQFRVESTSTLINCEPLKALHHPNPAGTGFDCNHIAVSATGGRRILECTSPRKSKSMIRRR